MDQSNTFFGTKVSKPGINVNNASDKQLVYKDNFSTKVYYDVNHSRIVEGLLPDGNYGMWVSKPGFDADSPNAAVNDNLVFNSNQDIFKIVDKKLISLTINTTGVGTASNSASVAHGLSYIPAYMAFITVDPVLAGFSPVGLKDGPNPTIISAASAGGAIVIASFSVTVDETNINFGGQLSIGGTDTFVNSATVYLLQETFN